MRKIVLSIVRVLVDLEVRVLKSEEATGKIVTTLVATTYEPVWVGAWPPYQNVVPFSTMKARGLLVEVSAEVWTVTVTIAVSVIVVS